MQDIVLVYMTFPSRAEASTIGRMLIEKKLAACVNFWEGSESFYEWEGKLEIGQETVMIAKTTSDVKEALLLEVQKRHTFQLPCVLFLPVKGGNPLYLEWVRQAVIAPQDD
jgi:periplasmic divalent cation tolerance protein